MIDAIHHSEEKLKKTLQSLSEVGIAKYEKTLKELMKDI